MKRLGLYTPVCASLLVLTGCGWTPEFNILGSYFPAWMFCMFAGIAVAVIVRLLVNRMHLQDYARPAELTYPSVALLFTFTLWLLLFS